MSAKAMPDQMSAATDDPSGAVAAAWSWNVVQRNAPGAISAIAFMVTPVRPHVAFTPLSVDVVSAMVAVPPRDLRTATGVQLWNADNPLQFAAQCVLMAAHDYSSSRTNRQLPSNPGSRPVAPSRENALRSSCSREAEPDRRGGRGGRTGQCTASSRSA